MLRLVKEFLQLSEGSEENSIVYGPLIDHVPLKVHVFILYCIFLTVGHVVNYEALVTPTFELMKFIDRNLHCLKQYVLCMSSNNGSTSVPTGGKSTGLLL